jgi:signal transduction histidine kinase
MSPYLQPFQSREPLRRFWIALSGVSVRTKIMGIVLGIVLLLGLTITLQVRATMRMTLTQELEGRGASIAGELAAHSTDLVLTSNLFALSELFQNSLAHHEEVRYAFVVNPDDRLLAHSFEGGFPPDLLTANAVNPNEHYQLEVLDTEEGLIWDFAIPILEGRAGTLRLGMSEKHLLRSIATTTERLLIVTALASIGSILGAFLLAWILTQPVKGLVSATEAISQGDLDIKAPSWFDDEIGHLGTAFNLMVDDLASAKQESDDYNQILLRRNRALEAMNAVARAVGGPMTLEEVLERALDSVLEVTEKHAAWTCLLDEQGNFSRLSTYICAPSETKYPTVDQCLIGCATKEVVQEMRPLVVPISATCPLAAAELPGGAQPSCHVTVPLVARSEVLGLLNIASDNPLDFGEEELQLLNAIGRQLGVAIDKARLLEELRHREDLRGQLLERVITAQEEERRRIARELHDETSQSLASLVVGLKAAEKAMPIDPSHSQEIMAGLRSSVSQTVKEVQNIIYDLRPTLLDDLGLIPALYWYTESRLKEQGVEVELNIEGRPKRLPPEVETTLFRITQEAVTNVVRHARASQVWLKLKIDTDAASIRVRDDGRGFQVRYPANNLNGQNGFGLLGIQERASLLGGKFEVRSTPGEGTDLLVWIPVSRRVVDDE